MKQIILLSAFLIVLLPGFSQEYTITEKNEKYGLQAGDFKLKEKYHGIYPCAYASDYLVLEKSYRFWLLNLQTKKTFTIMELTEEFIYDDSCFYEISDKIRLIENGKMGYYQFPETELIEPKYDYIYPVRSADSLFILQKGKKEFALHTLKSGNISPWFTLEAPEIIFNFDDNLSYAETHYPFPAKINNRWHIITWEGEVFPCVNTEFSGYNPYLSEYEIYLFPVEKNGKVGFIDHWGTIVIDFMYEDAYPFIDNVSPVKLNGKWGMADSENNILIPFVYEKIEIKDYRIWASGKKSTVELDEYGIPADFGIPEYNTKKEKFGYPLYGKKRGGIAYKFDGAKEFTTGLAAVNKGGKFDEENFKTIGGKWGYILPTGDLWIDYQYDEAGLFDNGRAKVKQDGREFYIDRYGKEIMPEGK